ELFRLPWNALLVGAQPLGSLAYVAVTPLPVGSPAMLPMFKPSGPALVVAATEIASRLAPDFPTLPDLDLEIDAVHQALPSATVLRGGQATVSAINSLLPGSGMLHFAGHSAPMPDGLRLVVAPDESHPDGLWLPTPESSACNIAILSACATGRYEEFESTDPHHLAHAFLLAGTRGVVASQWRVDSKATARFMKIFYGYVGGGSSVPEALQRASSEIRQRQEWRHPYYWSSFTLFVQS
ncbi:MAG TPA: CHAT domain-containing protein, partial [Candidatus Acidoferrum sp.]|nr:CHAT domain-containing protein [Candidatus Acidoferrum sp.]